MKFSFLTYSASLLLLTTTAALADTGGSCGSSPPLNFTQTCSATQTSGEDAYMFTFTLSPGNSTSNAATPLSVKGVYLQMGTNYLMKPGAGTPYSFFYNILPPVKAGDYSFIYSYQNSSGAWIQCQTQTFPIESCGNK